MSASEPSVTSSRNLGTLVTIILVVVILHFAKDVVLPFALAVLLSFLLSPIVQRLQRWGFADLWVLSLSLWALQS